MKTWHEKAGICITMFAHTQYRKNLEKIIRGLKIENQELRT